MATNSILPFANTTANIDSDSVYTTTKASAGNVAGAIASSPFMNRTLKQLSSVAVGIAQFAADNQPTNIVDTLTATQWSTILTNGAQSATRDFIGTSTSAANTYTATITGLTAYRVGMIIRMSFTNPNTGACTLNINSLGALNIVNTAGTALSANNLPVGLQDATLMYDGTNFVLTNAQLSACIFKATLSANQSLGANNVISKVNLNTILFDTNNCFNTTLFRFLPNRAGYYNITGSVGLAANTAVMSSRLWFNNVEVQSVGTYSTSGAQAISFSSQFYFNGTSDYIELFAGQTSASAQTITPANTFLQGFRIGAF